MQQFFKTDIFSKWTTRNYLFSKKIIETVFWKIT